MYTIEEIRHRLVGQQLTNDRLREMGISPKSKGKWGEANERLLGLQKNSLPLPDLGNDGELKTAVVDHRGEFRESLAVCMESQDPLKKLAKTVLVVARDLNDSSVFSEREVENVDVLLLRPSPLLMAALAADVELLRTNRKAKDTYFLELRTKGQGGGPKRYAYYIKKSRLKEYVSSVLRATEFQALRSLLVGREITQAELAAAGFNPRDKGALGKYVHKLAGNSSWTLRTSVVRPDGQYKEDLLITRSNQDPVAALERLVLVRIEPFTQGWRISDVIYLAPSPLVLHILKADHRFLTGNPPQPDRAFFLKLKTHHDGRRRQYSYYIRRSRIDAYCAALLNQPI